MSKACKITLLLRSEVFDISRAKGTLNELNILGDEGCRFICSDNRIQFEEAIETGKVYYMWLEDVVLTRKADRAIFEPVHLLRPINVFVPATGPEVKLLDISTGIRALYRISALDLNRAPIPHAKLTLFDSSRDDTFELISDACGQVLLGENPTVFRNLIGENCGLLMEQVASARGDASGH